MTETAIPRSTQFTPFPVAILNPKTGQADLAQDLLGAEFLLSTHFRSFELE